MGETRLGWRRTAPNEYAYGLSMVHRTTGGTWDWVARRGSFRMECGAGCATMDEAMDAVERALRGEVDDA